MIIIFSAVITFSFICLLIYWFSDKYNKALEVGKKKTKSHTRSTHFEPTQNKAWISTVLIFYMQHKLTKMNGHQEIRNNISKKQTEADCKDHRQTTFCYWGNYWMKSEHRSFVIYRRNTDEQYGRYNVVQNADFNANGSIRVWRKC